MGAAEIVALVAELMAKLGPLAIQAIEAEKAGDQASLDAIRDRAVAMSNAMAPAGAVVVPVL